MAVDYFLIDAPHTVPEEMEAMHAAYERWRAVFHRWYDAKLGSAERAKLDIEGTVLMKEVDRLEQVARAAWLKKIEAQNGWAATHKSGRRKIIIE